MLKKHPLRWSSELHEDPCTVATIASMKSENYPHAQFQFNQGLNRGEGNR